MKTSTTDYFVFAMCCLACSGVQAQTSRKPAPRHPPPQHAAPGPAHAPLHPAAATPAASAESIVVNANLGNNQGATNTTPGGGLMPMQTAPRVQSGITRDYIARQSPTTNGMALLGNLPGVVFSSQDPLGASSDNVSIRGLNQTEIGVVYEGVALNDSLTYIPYTENAADTENIQSMTLSQGAPDISAPFYGDVGGLITMTLRDPADKAGGMVNLSYGSKSLQREFGRIDSGYLGHSGVKAFVSFSNGTQDQWRGMGTQRKMHIDAKALKEWGDGNRASVVFSFDNNDTNRYRPVTMTQWKQYGPSLNYDGQYSFGDTNYYKFLTYDRRTYMVMAPLHFSLAKGLTLDVTPSYLHYLEYYGAGTTFSNTNSWFGTMPAGNLKLPYTNAAGMVTAKYVNPVPQRTGTLSTGLTWSHGINTFRFGDIYSYMSMSEPIEYQLADYQGNVSNQWGQYPVRLPDGRTYRTLDLVIWQQMNTLYLDDTLSLLNGKLKINAGFKYMMLSRHLTNNIPGADYTSGGSYSQPLPQVSVSYMITPEDQIFVDGTTSYRAPQSLQAYAQLFSTAKPGPVTVVNRLKGEYAIGEEIGYRHHGLVNVSLALFNYNLVNYQVQSTTFIDQVPIPTVLDAGGKTIRGAQIELGLRPWHHFSPYVSAQYLHATMDNNFVTGGDVLPTAGKVAIQSPEFTAAVGLSYDDGSLFGTFTFNYVGSQYSTFMDDEKIPAYETANLGLGYRFRNVGFAKHPQIQLNFMNIGANDWLSGLYSVGTNARPVMGLHGHMINASAPLYTIGGGFAAVASVSTGF
ncbi:TonB-dependent receptor [Gluconacetobacter tumulicola]|uniref:TonB-dependent receptor plug domain-containing protein n=1 Tax=Gluconacetobacter tumulicola TaxID=1017177 RepID=A0A7W4JH47_9PROT|nr:TonB-dependent receptor [Gluconacetobacter tumulicola]MBB2181128.1 TonB-dependent receptor plug domain-containing protein [Gluconacetobacter tumulicola]